MRELMLKLLTWEPFEKIKGDEADYISAVLNEQSVNNLRLIKYKDLMTNFERCEIEREEYRQYIDNYNKQEKELAKKEKREPEFKKYEPSLSQLNLIKQWKDIYYPAENNSLHKNREGYPVLFKKICVYCILTRQMVFQSREGDCSDEVIMDSLGMRANILNKWGVSTRYMYLAGRDTYSSFKINRNGLKKPYLTSVIKRVYYEAGNQDRLYLDVAKKYELATFCDVFAGTSTVAASVDAQKVVVNDFDKGVICFIFAVLYYKKEFKQELIQLHKDMSSEDMAGKYDLEDLRYHDEQYMNSIPLSDKGNNKDWDEMPDTSELVYRRTNEKFYDDKKDVFKWWAELGVDGALSDEQIEQGKNNVRIRNEFIKNMRSNYIRIQELVDSDYINQVLSKEQFDKLPTSKQAADYSKKAQIVQDIIDYGVGWFFYNAIEKHNPGKQGFETDITDRSYPKYIENALGFKYKNSKAYQEYRKDDVDAFYTSVFFANKLQLKSKDISFGFEGVHDFHKYMKNARIFSESFEKVFQIMEDERCFYYLDSPYFLSTDYNVGGFTDDMHKKMLDIIRCGKFKFLFSMQYYIGSTTKVKNVSARPQGYQGSIIKDYDTYYQGFYNELVPVQVRAKSYYKVKTPLSVEEATEVKQKLDSLYVILFDNQRRSPATNEIMICNFDARKAIKFGNDAAIIPMREFIALEESDKKYDEVFQEAVSWRIKYIMDNFSSADKAVISKGL